eukprot:2235723-Amphidinium_carterae.1
MEPCMYRWGCSDRYRPETSYSSNQRNLTKRVCCRNGDTSPRNRCVERAKQYRTNKLEVTNLKMQRSKVKKLLILWAMGCNKPRATKDPWGPLGLGCVEIE